MGTAFIVRTWALGLMILLFCASAFCEQHALYSPHPRVTKIRTADASNYKATSSPVFESLQDATKRSQEPIAASLEIPNAFGRGTEDLLKSPRRSALKGENDKRLSEILLTLKQQIPPSFHLTTRRPNGQEVDPLTVSRDKTEEIVKVLLLLQKLRETKPVALMELEREISPFLRELHRMLFSERHPAISFFSYDKFMRELSGKVISTTSEPKSASAGEKEILAAMRPLLAELNVSIPLPLNGVSPQALEKTDLRIHTP